MQDIQKIALILRRTLTFNQSLVVLLVAVCVCVGGGLFWLPLLETNERCGPQSQRDLDLDSGFTPFRVGALRHVT